MRHLHFTSRLEPLQGGGLGSSAIALHTHLEAAGFRSVLCATCGAARQQSRPGILDIAGGSGFPVLLPDMLKDASAWFARATCPRARTIRRPNLIFGREARSSTRPWCTMCTACSSLIS